MLKTTLMFLISGLFVLQVPVKYGFHKYGASHPDLAKVKNI